MRLLNTKTRRLEDFSNDSVPLYAILSHTWGEDEVTFQDVQTGKGSEKTGYQKVHMACSKSVADGFDYIWIDTCCIDKTSSAELSESINSMYRWYEESVVCYAYLADVSESMTAWNTYWGKESKFSRSRWFTRGWTLQELIAPSVIVFLDTDWEEIGTKSSLEGLISRITAIPSHVLLGEDLEGTSIAQRMSWASKRRTTRIEDLAYCLIGLFGITMPLLYGEGRRAFTRLQEEIMKISDDHSLFAWESHWDAGGILATSPAAFSGSSKVLRDPSESSSGAITMDSKGVHLKLLFVDGNVPGEDRLAILPCTKEEKHIAITLKAISETGDYFVRTESSSIKLLDPDDVRGLTLRAKTVCVRHGSSARRNQSPLLKAAAQGNEVVVRTLLKQRIELESKDEYGQTPLLSAAENGHEAVVKLLLERGAELQSKDRFGRTALSVATENGHDKVVKELNKKYAYLWSGTSKISSRSTLSRAAEEGDDMTVKLLLEKGINPDIRDKTSGQTPLSFAAANGHELVAKLLLEKGADLESRDTKYGQTPLLWAAARGNETLVKFLIESGADQESRDLTYGRTSMSWAAGNGHEAVVRFLVERGADAESRDSVPRTPLWLAIEEGHEAVAILLLESGVKPGRIYSRDDESRLLWRAEEKGYEKVVELLKLARQDGRRRWRAGQRQVEH